MINGLVQHGLLDVVVSCILPADDDVAVGDAERREAAREEAGQDEARADDDGHERKEVERVKGPVTFWKRKQ